MFTKASIVALFASVAAAQHTPVGNPSGNPITRPLNEVVPACTPFTITWTPTTTNTVSLILLRGPSTNVVPLSTLVVGIPNTGSYTWTPASTLEADTTHYGLQLIDDVNGQYQYSTQFGISKDQCSVSSSAAVVASTSAAVVASTSSAVVASTSAAVVAPSSAAVVSSSATAAPMSSVGAGYGYGSPSSASAPVIATSYPIAAVSSVAVPVVSSVAVPPYPSTAVSVSYPFSNTTMVYSPSGTGSYTKPSSISNGTTEFTGAASALNAAGFVAGVGAFAAFFL